MSVIIRLQNLAWEATAGDIRHFFGGLNIPDGNVHIVGGPEGDVFIGFATDEDARQAMAKTGQQLKSTCVRLLLSSRVEMNQVIDAARREHEQESASPSPAPVPLTPAIVPLSNTQMPVRDYNNMMPAKHTQEVPSSYNANYNTPRAQVESSTPAINQQQQPVVSTQSAYEYQQASQAPVLQRPTLMQQSQQPFAPFDSNVDRGNTMNVQQPQELPSQRSRTTSSSYNNKNTDYVPPLLGAATSYQRMQPVTGRGDMFEYNEPFIANNNAAQQQQKQQQQQQQIPQSNHIAQQILRMPVQTQQITQNLTQSFDAADVSTESVSQVPAYYTSPQKMEPSTASGHVQHIGLNKQLPRHEPSRQQGLLPMSPWKIELDAQPRPAATYSRGQQQQEVTRDTYDRPAPAADITAPSRSAYNNMSTTTSNNQSMALNNNHANSQYSELAQQQQQQNQIQQQQQQIQQQQIQQQQIQQQQIQQQQIQQQQKQQQQIQQQQKQQQPASASTSGSRKSGLLAMPPPEALLPPTPAPAPAAPAIDIAAMNMRMSMSVPPPMANILAPKTFPVASSNPLERSRHVRLENLPADCMHFRSLKSFLKPIPLSGDKNLVLLRDPATRRPIPIALVRLESDRDFHYVMSLDGQQGVRAMEASSDEFELAACNFNDRVSQAVATGEMPFSGPPVPMGSVEEQNRDARSCIRLENVPYRATGRDITEWLQTLGVPEPAKIQQVPKEEGRYSDTWTLEFGMRRDATRLLDMGHNRSKMVIHGRTVRVQRGDNAGESMTGVGHGERKGGSDRIDRVPGGRSRSPGRSRRRRSRSRSPIGRRDSDRRVRDSDRRSRRNGDNDRDSKQPPYVLQLSGLPDGVTADSLRTIFAAGFGGSGPEVLSVELVPGGQAHVHFADSNSLRKAEDKGDVFIGSNRIRVRTYDQRRAQSYIQSAVKLEEMTTKVKPEPLMRKVIEPKEHVDVLVLRSIGPVGCVLRCTGLPPDMRLQQLSAMFDNVGGLVESSVRMHYDDDGNSTGECLVSVFSADSAQLALRKLDGTQLAIGCILRISMAE